MCNVVDILGCKDWIGIVRGDGQQQNTERERERETDRQTDRDRERERLSH